MSEVEAYIAFGANLGNCHDTFVQARSALARGGVRVEASSPLYITQAVGGPADQPDYLNAVVRVKTVLSSTALLELCLRLENEGGRQRLQRWGARTLDLDLLLYGRQICDTDELVLPHPRLHLRRFVLEPLCALVPDGVHPVSGSTFARLLQQLPDAEQRVNLSELEW